MTKPPKKPDMQSPDLTQEKIAKLKELFPRCVTEAPDEDNNLKLTIDFDILKQMLSSNIVEGNKERYQINWPGKGASLVIADTEIKKTLRPQIEQSKNWETTQNLFIEGDNLDALKLLHNTYLNKVKMIYVDPPYNTGSDLLYDDDFEESVGEYLEDSEQKDEYGNRMQTNTETNGRFHSDWLTMMYSRLSLAWYFLRDDGVIFISIDDNEQANLKRLCDEIFGDSNFAGVFIINSTPNARDYGHIGKMHEYVLMYAKNKSEALTYQIPEPDKKFKYSDEQGDFNIHPLYNSNVKFNKDTSPSLYYPFYLDPNSKQGDFYKISLTKNENHIEVFPSVSQKEKVQFVWRWGKVKAEKELNKEIVGYKTFNGGFRIVQKMRHTSKRIRSLLIDKKYSTRTGTSEVEKIFGKKIFPFPKPLSLIKILLVAGTVEDDIVLDLFAGSGTVAHAVMELNAEDGGNRKFICVQMPEPCKEDELAFQEGFQTIADVAKERIRRTGDTILEDLPLTDWNKDIGFRVLKIDTSNMKDIYYSPADLKQKDLEGFVDHIKHNRTSEDLLLQFMLNIGMDLTLPMVKKDIEGREVFFVNEKDTPTKKGEILLIGCFERMGSIDTEFCKILARQKPARAVFRDGGFKDDSTQINVAQIFKTISPKTIVRVM